jgi:hypothetical protein
MQPLDPKSRQYLSRVADKIGFLHADVEGRPAELFFSKKDIQVYFRRQEPADDIPINVYLIDAGKSEFLSQGRGEGSTNKDLYATDWPVEEEDGYHHRTYVFEGDPSLDDIKTACLILKIKECIRRKEVDQHYDCSVCSCRQHWTDTKNTSAEQKPDLRERAQMLQQQVCCCEELREIKHHRQSADVTNSLV